jgi:autotransporter-associated beta strand protein
MALVFWKAAVSGDWSTAADWSTNTVPSSADNVEFDLIGNYLVTVTHAQTANSLDFNAPGAQLVESSTGKLTLNGLLVLHGLLVENGYVELDAVNTISSSLLDGGVLATGRTGALGSGELTLAGGELLATASETLTNQLELNAGGAAATVTIAAAHSKVLTLNGSLGWTFGANMTLDFGAPGVDGVVVWHTPAGSSGAPVAIDVHAGTLRAGDSNLSTLFSTGLTTISSGATIDLAGFSTTIVGLSGSGRVTNSGAAATITLAGTSLFGGSIIGPLSVTAAGLVRLTGANTYTGSTTISPGGALQLGAGSTTGSIATTSPILDNGELVILRANALTLANAISGSGAFAQIGTGTTTINTANSYSGGTIIDAGTLAVGNAGALGGGGVTINGGEFEGTANETFANFLTLGGSFAIAAAHGRTFTVGSGGWLLNENAASTISFGATGQDGTVVLSDGGVASISNPGTDSLEVRAGTLKAGDSGLAFLLQNVLVTAVDAGATIDLAGFSTTHQPGRKRQSHQQRRGGHPHGQLGQLHWKHNRVAVAGSLRSARLGGHQHLHWKHDDRSGRLAVPRPCQHHRLDRRCQPDH